MNHLTLIPSDSIIFHHDQIRTSSTKVAEAFGRNHRDVLRKIKALSCTPEFTERNFALSKYKDPTGRTLTMYEMTKDGFIFLVMGFTGKKAAQVKEAYINAFNAMAERIAKREAPQRPPKTLTPAMQRHVQTVVSKMVHMGGHSYPAVWGTLKDAFNVGTYKDIPAERYPALCRYLGVKPRVAEGEWLEPERTELAPLSVPVNCPATGKRWCYDYLDMHNCGWNTHISGFLQMLSQHQGEAVTLDIKNVAGLQKEVNSLMHLVEKGRMHLENIKSTSTIGLY